MVYHELFNRSENWLKYAIQVNLFLRPKEEIVELRTAALTDARIQSYLDDIANFHGALVTNHKNPVLPINKLRFCWILDLTRISPKSKQQLMKFFSIGMTTASASH